MLWGMLLIVALALAACDDDSGVTLQEAGVEETQTADARKYPSATPGPSPTPLPPPTPYASPTPPPDMDGDMVLARVGTREITLDEFRARVRFERWYRLYQIKRVASRQQQVLDLTLAGNAWVSSVFATLADDKSFGKQVLRVMIIDEIALDEGADRGLEPGPQMVDSQVAQFMGATLADDGSLPEDYDEFLQEMKRYSGLDEEDLRRIALSRAYYSVLKGLVGQEAEIDGDTEARIGTEVQDILLDTYPEAMEVVERLSSGEAMSDIAPDFGFNAAADETSRLLRWSDQNVDVDVLEAVFRAEAGDVIGPIATGQGFYVARVGDEVFDVLSPADIQALREQYFLDWVEARMDDADYVVNVVEFDAYEAYVPQAPLPQDVSPLLRSENIILPDGSDQFDLFDVPEEPPTP